VIVASAPGGVLLLGVSRENITRLVDGKPIRVSRATHGNCLPEGQTIVIVFSETEKAILKELVAAGVVTLDTKIVEAG